MTEIRRDILDKSVRQRKLIFQQQRPLLNYELNLVQDILSDNIEGLTKASIGDNYSGESLQVFKGDMPNEVVIRKGTFYHEGVPITLTSDKRVSIGAAPSSGMRYDVIYATWRKIQVDSLADPLIGFVTSKQERIHLDLYYELGSEYPQNVPPEVITFDSDSKTITLDRGDFPDWMRIPGTAFRTNVRNNLGDPFFSVASSPDSKTIVVNENIANITLSDARFIEYSSSLDIPKEYRAFRENIIVLAVLERYPASYNINDSRPAMANNFVVSGCIPSKPISGLTVDVSEGEFLVSNDKEFIEDDTSITIADNSFNYIYLDNLGELQYSTSEPSEAYVALAEVQTLNGEIVDFRDVRKFKPAGGGSSRSSEASGVGSGLTGFTTISQNFISDDNIDYSDLVFLDTNSKVKRASASSKDSMPVVAIANQATALGQKNTFVTYGLIEDSGWSWTPGEDLFADVDNGNITNAAGVEFFQTGQYIQRIGVAVTSTKIFFKPELTIYRKDPDAEIALLTLRDNGDIEVMGDDDRISPDRLNFLASAPTDPASSAFNILPGRYFLESAEAIDFLGQFINMGMSGSNFRTTAIPAFFFNKAYFTLDKTGTVKMYEGIPSASVPSEDPVIPDTEIPLSVVIFEDNGSGVDGSIRPILREHIIDKRPWVNIGQIDDGALRAIYRSDTQVLVQAGEAWISKKYFILEDNLVIDIPTSDGDYYFYFDISNVPDSGSDLDIPVTSANFTASFQQPLNLSRRDFILLARYTVSSGVILRNSFRTYKSKYWDYQDRPYLAEQTWELTTPEDTFVTTSSATLNNEPFSFTDRDFLKITINGMEIFEGEDYVKDGNTNTVTMSYPILTGAKVKVRKV